MIIVPTILNTGTHFLLNLLGIKPKGMLWEQQENGIAYGHIYPRYKDIYMPLIEDNLTIIPLRHPLVVAESWKARGGNIFEMIDMWEFLVNEIHPLNPVYLPIDSPYRDIALGDINAWLGMNMTTDWSPVSSVNGNHPLRHEDVEGDKAVLELVDRISGFLNRFYNTEGK